MAWPAASLPLRRAKGPCRVEDLFLESRGALVWKEAGVLVVANVRQRHRVPTSEGAAASFAEPSRVGETELLPVTRGARDAIVARQARIIEEHAAERGARV